jgi:hypothetical protein
LSEDFNVPKTPTHVRAKLEQNESLLWRHPLNLGSLEPVEGALWGDRLGEVIHADRLTALIETRNRRYDPG